MDDRDIGELLHDAVADVEPTDRLAEIRDRTSTSSRRTGWYAAGGSVLAVAAALTAFAVIGDPAQHDADPDLGCMVVTGSEKAFAAGADIRQMAQASVVEMIDSPFIGYWDKLGRISKPIVAVVSGWCLGGGCELAMACDFIVAAESAVFG